MERRKKIDESLKERHNILRLLERLKSENITYDEIEEIGVKLRKSGKRALSPLVRRLWRERNSDLISKYTYLLDFFEDDVWLDQLIQMTLRRRDLEDDGKAAFLAALEGYGVDVTSPPFSTLLAELSGPLKSTLPRLLEKGEEGLISFLEDILFADPGMRRAIIRELPSVQDQRVIALLEVLLRVDDRDIVDESIATLGRIRDVRSVEVLEELIDSSDMAIAEQAQRSLRRLSFVGMETGRKSPHGRASLPFYKTCASPFDGAGYRILWLCRWRSEESLSSLFIQIHETSGVTAAWGSPDLEPDDFSRILEEARLEDGVVEVDPGYALTLANDAVYQNGIQSSFLPAEFYVMADMFQRGELAPAPYTPEFKEYDLPGSGVVSRMLAKSASLFDDDFFAAWVVTAPRVYDYAEEWTELERNSSGGELVREMEYLVERFCAELFPPEMEAIHRRLILTADLMRRTGRERELVMQTLLVALNVQNFLFPLHKHPFLRRYAVESMDMAREALAEGYDPREMQHGDEDWE
jgi:hypothetical protein